MGESRCRVRIHFFRLAACIQHVNQLGGKFLRANAISHSGDGGRSPALPLKFDGNRLRLIGEPIPVKLRKRQNVLAIRRDGADGLFIVGEHDGFENGSVWVGDGHKSIMRFP